MTFPQNTQGNEIENEARNHLVERDRERHDRYREAVDMYPPLATSKADREVLEKHLEANDIQFWAAAEGDKYPDEIRARVIQSCVDCVNKILDIRANRRCFHQIADMSYRANGEIE
jgi:hypothetical protein